jgi:predicted nucleotidyltransferase
MTNINKIKVIKREDISAKKPVKKIKQKSSKAVAHEMVTTVTNWVTEFQQKRREETATAIRQLLNDQPEPRRA